MSLDVYLTMNGATKPKGSGIFIRESGSMIEISREEWDTRFPGREPIVVEPQEDDNEVFTANITHNLNKMADEAGIYKHLWRPQELNIKKAKELIVPLSTGLSIMRGDPERFKKFNPANGWGTYGGLVGFVEDYLNACREYPEADVRVWA